MGQSGAFRRWFHPGFGRSIRGCAAASVVAASIVVVPVANGAEAPEPCGLTTLEATVTDLDGDGILECGPGEDLVRRTDLAKTSATGTDGRAPLLALLLFADFQIADEELTLPSRSDWRGHPAMIPHMVNAGVKAANRIIRSGSPVLGEPYDMAFALGDLADNAQYNETRLVIDLMDGQHLVDPGSGAAGYDGAKSHDPLGRGDLRTPVQGERILDLANEPFYAEGLRNPDGSPVPWYAVHGNHDSKVMGHIPHEDASWREAANRWATGDKKIFRLNARYETELNQIREHSRHEEPAFWMRIFDLVATDPSSVGDVRTVPADDGRHILSKEAWIDELAKTTGTPVGHGFGEGSERCPDVYPDAHARRACYAFDHGKFRFIVLDDNPLEGYSTGSVDRPQARWLEAQIKDASSTYFDADGTRITNPYATDRYVVVLSHHLIFGMTNDGTTEGSSDEIRDHELKNLLLRYPNVILHAAGHSHENRLWPRKDKKKQTQYWEVNVASVADHPHNGRSIEIVDNRDGTLSMFGVLFDTAVHPDPRGIDWERDDPTDEVELSDARRKINEDWLAAAGFEQAATDIAGHRYGAPDSRNVEMVIRDPLAGGPVVRSGTVDDHLRETNVPILAVGMAAGFGLLRRTRRRLAPRSRPDRRRGSGPQPRRAESERQPV